MKEIAGNWLSVFDQDELKDFIQDILSAYQLANNSEEFSQQVAAIIHEWHESAIAIASPDLATAFTPSAAA